MPGAGQITLAERSGMGDTRANLEKLGIFALAEQVDFRVVVLDEEPAERWAHIERSGNHWSRGFYLAKVVLEADVVIQTCCLKTHGYGGHFTMSLKNSVGLVAKKVPGGDYDYMHELHGSPAQRLMIAEINAAYPVDFVIMDAALAFIDGGPDKGTEVAPGLMLASADRVALDAAGVAHPQGVRLHHVWARSPSSSWTRSAGRWNWVWASGRRPTWSWCRLMNRAGAQPRESGPSSRSSSYRRARHAVDLGSADGHLTPAS